MEDLSFLSNDELVALKAGDYSKLSNESLVRLRGQQVGGQAPVSQPSPDITPNGPQREMGIFDRILGQLGALGGPIQMAPIPSATSQPSELQAYQKGITKTAAETVRYGGPIAAIPLTAGMGTIPAALTLAGAGAASETLAQAGEILGGARPQGFEAEPVAVSAAMGGGGRLAQIPARTGLGRIGAATVSGAGAGAGKVLVERGPEFAEKVSLGEYQRAVMDEALPGLYDIGVTAGFGTLLGGLAENIRAAAAAGGAPAGQRMARFVAELLRPTELSPQQLAALQNRNAVMVNTGFGPRDVPPAMSEIVGTGELTRRIRDLPNAENTADTLDHILRLSLFSAARIDRSNRTADQIARNVYEILNTQRDQLNNQAREAIDNYARYAANAVNQAQDDLAATGTALFPRSVSRREGGTVIRRLANEAMVSAENVWDAAYARARGVPGYGEVLVDTAPVIDEATNLGYRFARDESGRFSLLGAPAGARSALTAAGSLPRTMSLEEARNLVSTLGRSIRNRGVLPGVDIGIRNRLYDVAQDSLENSLQTQPAIRDALGEANRIYRENITRFRSRFAEGALREFGERGGTSPEGIVNRLLGPESESMVDELDFILGAGRGGAGTAGVNLVDEATQVLRETVLTKAAVAGARGQARDQISIANAFRVIEQLPDAVQQRLFPNLGPFRDAIEREAALAASRGTIVGGAENFIQGMRINPVQIERALGVASAQDLRREAQALVNNQTQHLERVRQAGLRAQNLDSGDVFNLVDYIEDGGNVPRLQNLVTRVQGENPALMNEVRAEFLNRVIARGSNAQGIADPQRILGFLQAQTPGAAGQQAGIYANQLDIIFGPDEAQRVRGAIGGIAGLQGQIPEPVGRDVNRSLFRYILLGTPGTGNVGSVRATLQLLGRVLDTVPEIRYRTAAWMLADPNLRVEALRPIGEGAVRAVDSAVNAVVGDLRKIYGKKHPLTQEAMAVEQSIPDR